MATIPNSVSPGDLILANLFNEVVIVLNDHEQRLQTSKDETEASEDCSTLEQRQHINC